MLRGYVITSVHESLRAPLVQQIRAVLPNVVNIEAIYPTKIHVPFLAKLKQRSAERVGRSLTDGEIGLILTSRLIWREIVKNAKNDEEHFLILESDSKIVDPDLLLLRFQELTQAFDLFFWGSWLGHLRVLRSKRKVLKSGHVFGEPLMNSVSGTYGYSVNRKAAAYLLKATAKIAYPVDEFKRYVKPDSLRFGGIVPEVITVHDTVPTTIGRPVNKWKEKILIFIFDLRNYFLSWIK